MSVGANKADTDTACCCWTNSSLAETVEAAKVCKFPSETKGGIQSRKQGGKHFLFTLKNSEANILVYSVSCISPQDIASSLKNCTKTFSKCRKYEDEAITTILACRTNPTELKQKVRLWSRKNWNLYARKTSPKASYSMHFSFWCIFMALRWP